MSKWSVELLYLSGASGVLVLTGGMATVAVSRAEHPQMAMFSLAAAIASLATVGLMRLSGLIVSRNATHTLPRLSERRFHHLVETTHDGIWVVDRTGATTYANRGLARMFGCAQDEIGTRSFYEYLDANPPATLAALLSPAAGEDADTYDLSYRRRDGSTGWAIASARPVLDDKGRVSGALLTLTDISRRKQAELELGAMNARLEARVKMRTEELMQSDQQLRAEVALRQAAEQALEQSDKRLQEIISTLPVALLIKDAQLRITMMNKAAEDGWGVRFDQVAGTDGSQWIAPQRMKLVRACDQAAFAARELLVQEDEVWNAAKGKAIQAEVYKKPVYHANGEPHYLICVYVDITQRKRAKETLQASLRQLRQLTTHLEMLKAEERKRIAQGIHDHLGQNLMALKIDVEMLHARAGERHPLLKRRVGHVLNTIDVTIRSVRTIINDLHPSTLELGLAAALEWLVDQFEKRSGICCTLRVIGEAPPMPDTRRTSVIFRMVQEALVNVLNHAEANQVAVFLNIGPEKMTITIIDDGTGRGDEAAKGLRGIRERVALFGGELDIADCEGGGTKLSIFIPTETGTANP